MKESLRSGTPIDREEAGASVEAHGYIVTPVVRVRGRVGGGDDERATWSYGWAALRPVKMRVVDPTGQIQEVRLVSAEGQAIKALAGAALLVALASVLLSLLARSKQKSS